MCIFIRKLFVLLFAFNLMLSHVIAQSYSSGFVTTPGYTECNEHLSSLLIRNSGDVNKDKSTKKKFPINLKTIFFIFSFGFLTDSILYANAENMTLDKRSHPNLITACIIGVLSALFFVDLLAFVSSLMLKKSYSHFNKQQKNLISENLLGRYLNKSPYVFIIRSIIVWSIIIAFILFGDSIIEFIINLPGSSLDPNQTMPSMTLPAMNIAGMLLLFTPHSTESTSMPTSYDLNNDSIRSH